MSDVKYAVGYAMAFSIVTFVFVIALITPCSTSCGNVVTTTTTITSVHYSDGSWNNSTSVNTLNLDTKGVRVYALWIVGGIDSFFLFGTVVMTISAIQERREK